MSDEYVDPSGNTEAFRAFQTSPSPVADQPSRLPLIIGVAVAVVIVVAIALWLVL
ncbi:MULTISPECIES: hypothetical protein [unclassified Solwaraspora]|uniref:hypothetical protein n=1 Tax=unclassified Solwaraspora TaxID=2627926 RepID=UPI00248CFA44|nr:MULTISPECIES: hypothetical protein [unclassified Solwaraspora]WBB98102.1 hypothetical protein O7553_03885 [Solwaraspora sp. WMMA2059]WBC23343.1 hypothetical protein O7543_13475 [Solwaraspora sp. WMMA2080]WJK34574.1 hypothetical protein O7610_28965 [Solwaraspora sp. WMMA2065]